MFVLKQGWERIESGNSCPDEPFEATAHRQANLYECRIYSSESVFVGDEVDTTLGHIRRGLCHSEAKPLFQVQKHGFTESTVTSHVDQESNVHERFMFKDEYPQIYYGSSRQPVPRVFTRMIMATWGWPIKYFKDQLELLTVIRDAVEGQFNCASRYIYELC